jgi:hypothetical protein
MSQITGVIRKNGIRAGIVVVPAEQTQIDLILAQSMTHYLGPQTTK